MATYNKAPLPFQGQKRNWLREIKALSSVYDGKTVVDLFGGSGLLSNTIKQCSSPKSVLWNDFDNYQSRLDMIEETEMLRQALVQYCSRSSKKLDEVVKAQVITYIDAHISIYKRIDLITLSSWILFSGNYAHSYSDLISRTFYTRIPLNPLRAEGYLDGVTRVQCDFRELLKSHAEEEDTIYICDPPYIMTDQTGYSAKNDPHFRLKDTLQLMEALRDKQALFFSSTKSETDDLLGLYFNPDQIKRIEYETSSGAGRKYTELLYLLNI